MGAHLIPGRNVPGITHPIAPGVVVYVLQGRTCTTTRVWHPFFSAHIHTEKAIKHQSRGLHVKMSRKEYIFKAEGSEGIAADVFYPEGDSTTTFPLGSWERVAILTVTGDAVG